jgi:hypothetical protein
MAEGVGPEFKPPYYKKKKKWGALCGDGAPQRGLPKYQLSYPPMVYA